MQLRLLKSLYQASEGKEAFKILTNILIATLHINFLVMHPFRKQEMPRLRSQGDLIAQLTSSRSLLSKEEEIYLGMLVEDSQEDSAIHLPLQLALSISPLYLLLPNKLCRKDVFGRQSIINVSSSRFFLYELLKIIVDFH